MHDAWKWFKIGGKIKMVDFLLDQWSSIGGPRPHPAHRPPFYGPCYSFTMWIGWVSMCTCQGLHANNTQTAGSLTAASATSLSLLFLEQFAYSHFAGGRRLKMACFQVNCSNRMDSENWRLREIWTWNLHSFSLQPGQASCIWQCSGIKYLALCSLISSS